MSRHSWIGLVRRVPTIVAPLIAVVAFLMLAGVPPAAAQAAGSSTHPLIVLTELTAPSGDTVAEKLSSTISASLELVMRLTGSLKVERADFLTPTLSFSRALEYYRQIGAGGAVFGSVTPTSSGGYAVLLEVWNGEKPQAKPVVISRKITNLLSSFGIADRLSLEVASTVVGRKLEEGTLVVTHLGGLSEYSVYADGHLLGRNEAEFRLLTGKREIVVAKPGIIGDEPVEVFHVEIRQGQTTTVALANAGAAPGAAAGSGASPPAVTTSAAPANPPGIYAVGEVGGTPVYWENGALHELPLGIKTTEGKATAITFDRAGNLYIAGDFGPAKDPVPVYWKNGVIHALPLLKGDSSGTADGVLIGRKGDLYLVGSSGAYPASWTNGELRILDSGNVSYDGVAMGMAEDRQGNIVIVGYLPILDPIPVAWKDGKLNYLVTLAQNYNPGEATGMVFGAEGRVYASGFSGGSYTTRILKPVYWVDDHVCSLPLPSTAVSGAATAVALDSEGNVYLAGYVGTLESSRPVYWVDGEPHLLPTDTALGAGKATSISVDKNGSVYIGGYIGSVGSAVPAYWVNGALRVLPVPTSVGRVASGQVSAVVPFGAAANGSIAPPPIPGRVVVNIKPVAQEGSDATITLRGRPGAPVLTEMGSTRLPFAMVVKPGNYLLRASLNNDTGAGYEKSLQIRPGEQTSLTIPLDYSREYKLGVLRDQRAASVAALDRVRTARSVKTAEGTTLEVIGGVGAGLGGVLGLLYLSAPSGSAAASGYGAAALGSAAAGAVSLLMGIRILDSRPPLRGELELEQSLKRLDAQINALNRETAAARGAKG